MRLNKDGNECSRISVMPVSDTEGTGRLSKREETKAGASRIVRSPDDDSRTYVDGVDGDGGDRFTLKSNRGSEPMIEPVMPLKPGKSRVVNPMQIIQMSRFGASR